jgi:hypothetical protein
VAPEPKPVVKETPPPSKEATFRVLNVVVPMVFVEVTRHKPGVGKVKKWFKHKIGDRVGADPRTGSTEHEFTVRGNAFLLDMDTGYTIRTLDEKKFTFQRLKFEPEYNEEGYLKGYEILLTPVSLFSMRIVFEGEGRRPLVVYFPEPKARRVPLPPACEPPPAELDAVRLLERADCAWQKEEKTRASALYREFAKKYKDTAVFRYSRKRIAGRFGQRK